MSPLTGTENRARIGSYGAEHCIFVNLKQTAQQCVTMLYSRVCSHHVHRLVATLVYARQARYSAHGDHRTARDRSDPLGATHNIGGRHAAKNDILEAKLERRARSSCNPSLRVREPPKQPLARIASRLMEQTPYMLQTSEKNSLRLVWRHFNDKCRKKVCPR